MFKKVDFSRIESLFFDGYVILKWTLNTGRKNTSYLKKVGYHFIISNKISPSVSVEISTSMVVAHRKKQ